MSSNELLYQKYRPMQLSQVIGHDKTVKEIESIFEKNSFPQVVCIEGITGTGKTTLARIIAKIINCQNKPSKSTCCDKCEVCNDINNENFAVGAHELNASMLDTESVRDIENLTNTQSFVTDKTIIMIDELQELAGNKKASKVLLKLLERKNSDLHFILMTMDSVKLDKAILNRCTSFKLKPVKSEVIADNLISILEKENFEVKTEEQANVIFAIAEASGGSVRQAISYLERFIEGNIQNEKELLEVLNITTTNTTNELCLKLIDKDPTIFKIELTQEVLDSIRRNISLLFQALIGVQLEVWQKNNINGILGYKKATKEGLLEILEVLDMTFKYPYLNREIINTILFRLFVKPIQSEKVMLKEEVKVEHKTIPLEQPRRRREE